MNADRSDHGTLVLAATPLGNPADASPRLRTELAGADVVAAEDTRRLKRLCADLSVVPSGRVLSYHDHNESVRTGDLLRELEAGHRVLVITDAGMPSVSDPGYRLVSAAIAAEVRVTCVPGPSAVTTALALSGLPTDRFCFEGFAPRKQAERRRTFAALVGEPRTMVLFEAPHRLADTLADLAEAFGPDRPAALCRELTKTYEEVRRATLGALARQVAAEPVRGEVTLVVGGAVAVPMSQIEAVERVRRLVAQGVRLKAACRDVAATSAVSSRDLYAVVVSAKGGRTQEGEPSLGPRAVPLTDEFSSGVQSATPSADLGRLRSKQRPIAKGPQAMTDPGHVPHVFDIEAATLDNTTFRTTLWTGTHLQVTVMSIEPGDDIGLEMHPDVDQFLRLEAGTAKVEMGLAENDLSYVKEVEDDWVILVPAGHWHNITNVGASPLKVYSIYGPPNHPHGTVHATKAEADAAEAAEHGH